MHRRFLHLTAVTALAIGIGACDAPTPTGIEQDSGAIQALITPLGTSTGTSDLCGDVTNPPAGLPGVQRQSPCDAAHSGAGLPLVGGTYFLSPLVDSPASAPANFAGLASRLKVHAYPYPDQAYCEALSGANSSQCAIRTNLPAVAEDLSSGLYSTTWKTVKRGNGDKVPNDSYWQIVLMLDFDGDGQWADDEDVASRIIKWTDTPSSDNPADGWSLDINRGSNQPIKMVLEANAAGCFGTARAQNEVECLVDFSQGGTLAVEVGTDGVILDIGAGNGAVGLATVSGQVCGLSGGPQNLVVDLPVTGTCITWEVTPPLAGQTLVGTSIFVCENLGGTPNLDDYLVHMQDGQGTQALSPVDATAACAASGFLANGPGGFDRFLGKLAGLFRADELHAGAGALGHGSPGGGILTIGSDFQLALASAMEPVSALETTVPEYGSTTLEVGLANHDGFAAPGVAVTIYSDLTSTVTCVDAGCTPILAGLPPTVGSGVITPSDANGLARAVWTVSDQTATAWALGCGIAVPGSDTPANGGFAGDGGLCDLDPSDVDGPDGFANGPVSAVTDPFNTPDGGSTTPIFVNDLPIEFTASVCSSPTVDGVRSTTDPWSQPGLPNSCTVGSTDSFNVSLGGNLGGGGTATIEWFVGADANGDQRIYFGLEVPVSKDPSKVKLAIEFDAGDGSTAGTSDEFDDQLELSRDKSSANPVSGDVFDRYLTASCAGNSSISVCNALDTNVGGTSSAEGGVRFDASNGVLFFEVSQRLDGDVPYDLHGLTAGEVLGFILQVGVGNVQQSGTVWPPQSGGPVYRTITIP